MDVTVVDELNTIEATTVDLTVEVPNTSPSVDVTQQRLNTDVTLNNNQIVVEGGLTIENVNETFDVETNSVVITLDVVDPGSTVVVKESVLDVAVEAKTEIVEVLYGPGGGGITIADMNAIYAYAGADSANTVTNNRFFTNLFGWTISGGGTRLERTDPEVPANAPSQFVCKFGGQLARYTGKVLNVVNGERVYAEVSVATLAGGAPTISLKAFRYGPTGVKLGEETLDFANATSAWTRLAGFFETPNDGTTTVEFVLEISGANNTYDNTKRWYFTNGKLYSTASEEILSASIETINTILYDPIDGLTVQYSLALNNNGRITGIRANATGTETDFAILTDKFYVLDPSDNNNYEQVFEIVNGVVKLRELIANDITTTTITVKNNGQIKVQDSQMVPVDRVEIGKIGADYGLRVRNAAGDIIFNVDSLGANTVNSTQLVSGAVTPGKTNIAAINSGSGNLNSDVVDVANIINGAVTAAKTNLAAINSGTGNLNSNTVDTAQIIASAVTAAKTNLAAINSGTGNLNSNTVDTAQIIASAVTAAKTNIAAINSGTGNLNSNTVDTAQIINGAISDAAKFSNSIRPVEVVGALPGSGNFDGRTVFLTTDKKIYRYDAVAGSYTASVPAGDLSGQITGTQITDGSITTPKIAANAVTANEIAANTITAAKIAANTITAGQIAAGTITATQIAANSITASRLIITNTDNLIQDCDLLDANSWNFDAGWTINTADSLVSTNLQARAALKSANGNGTTTQADSAAFSRYFPIERNKSYRVSGRVGVTSGFTGRTQVIIQWFDRTYGYLSTSAILGTDYRTSAAGAITVQDIDGLGVAPSNAYYARYGAYTNRSTTLNNAGNAYFAFNWVQRAASGELIVDGTITAAKIQAGTITATQIAAGTITATQIAANSITASRLVITNTDNLIADSDLVDSSYWVFESTWVINNDALVTTNLQARAALKSPTGNGTMSQSTSATYGRPFTVERNKSYRVSARVGVTSGFTGVVQVAIQWFDKDYTYISATAITSTDYRTSAAGSITVQELDGLGAAPSNAYYGRFLAYVQWSTTQNNAGNVYSAFNWIQRAASGELIVDGTITATKIAANTITAGQIAANTITAGQIAANTITASRLLLGDTSNMVSDADLADASYWSLANGMTINSADTADLAAIPSFRAFKTATGNGTMSQAACTAYVTITNWPNMEPSKPVRYSASVRVKSGFTGRIYLVISHFDRVRAYAGSDNVYVIADYRTTAAGADTLVTGSAIGTVSATTAFVRYGIVVDWSTTQNNAQVAYIAVPKMSRAVNAELIVDGTITAAKIQAGTITATQIAANSITASRIVLTDAVNMIRDSEYFEGSALWNAPSGPITYVTSDALVTALNAIRVAKITGAGLSEPAFAYNYLEQYNITIEPTKSFHCSVDYAVTSGFNGYIYADIVWLDNTGTILSLSAFGTPADYLTVAAGSTLTGTLSEQVTPAAGAVRAIFRTLIWWGADFATRNKGGTAGFTRPYMRRAVNAELIVDGTITAAKIQAGTITGDRIAANTITATRLLLTDGNNLIADSEFYDASYWNLGSGHTINTTDTQVTTTLGVRGAIKSDAGNGTMSQTTFYTSQPTNKVVCELNKPYRIYTRVCMTAGFTGSPRILVGTYNRLGAFLNSYFVPVSVDYRTVALGAETTATLDGIITIAEPTAYFISMAVGVFWSTTQNNAGRCYFTQWNFNRANNAELIVDGTITAAKIQANTITAAQIAANTITAGQIAAGTITATQIAANTITASRLLITNSYNMIADADLRDASYWSIGSGWAINTADSIVTTNLQARAAWKSATGNGTTSQATTGYSSGQMQVEPGKTFRASIITAVSAGYTGMLYLFVNWLKRDGTASGVTPFNFTTTTSYKASAAGVITLQTLDVQYTAPSDAYYATIQVNSEWSTTLNNAGNAYVAFMQFNRAASGELIVDGSISAAKILANTITSNQIATDTIRSSDWNATTKQGWRLGTNGDIDASSISIWAPGVSPKKIFGASGMSYNGSNFYGLDQIITKINKASEDGSPDTQIFDGTNPDTWVDLCDLAITATGGQDIDIDVSTDMLIEQLFDPTVLIKYAVGSPEFRFRLRRTQGSTVDIKTSEWYKITSVGQVPAALFTVRDTTAVAGAATYLLQAQWRKGYYNTGTVSKSAVSETITGSGVSWLANIGASGSINEGGFPGIRASGSINFAGQPANGNTFTLNGTTVTFVTGTPTGNQVQIGINLNTTINNAVSFLNGSADAQISKCTYFNGGGTQIIIFYDVIGTAGNSFTLAEVGANTTVSGATLAGGQAAPSIPWEIKVASVDPNWWPINTITSRTGLTFNPDTSGYNALSLASLTNAAYEIRANFHAVIMRLKNYTIRTTEYRNTAVT